MGAVIINYIKRIEFWIRWLTMSENMRYAYLWKRTKNSSSGWTSRQTLYRSNRAHSTMERYISKAEEYPLVKRIVIDIGSRFLNVLYHFRPQADSNAASELDYVLVNAGDWQAPIEKLGNGYLDHMDHQAISIVGRKS